MTEVLDRKPPKPVVPQVKTVAASVYLSQEPVLSDIHCEYSRDILVNYYETEECIDPKCLSRQSEFTFKHRAILVDWIHSTHKRFKLQAETLFLSVNILDRYISCRSIRVAQMQLLGLAVLFLAAKYEEIYAPELKSLLNSLDSAFLKEQAAILEKDILAVLDYSITRPTSLKFYQRYAEILGLQGNLHSFGMYLMELGFDFRLVAFRPSTLASAAVVLTHVLFHKELACKMKKKICLDLDIKNCTKVLIGVLEVARENPLKSVWDKFSKRRYHCVSSLTLF